MKLKLVYSVIALLLYNCNVPKKEKETVKPPNIIYILADDLGYGDVSIYNSDSKIQTPNIDKLAKEGMRFTDAHSPSSVCTPTRYGILTGRYCWRTKLPKGVLWGYGEGLLEDDRKTIASLLKEKQYTTGVVGKWHLGLDWVLKPAYIDSLDSKSIKRNEFGVITHLNGDWVDFTKKPTDGPLNHGFDYSYILPASLDIAPYCYLENDVLTELPDERTEGNRLDAEIYATGAFWRAGRKTKSFDFYEVLPTFIDKAKSFVQSHANDEKPFFLYLPLAAPHSPWVPKKDYVETSDAGEYGDFVQMVDDQIGEFLKSLEETGNVENTIVVFTSDNGPYWRPQYIEKYEHRAASLYKGMKGDIHEGGHRVPFIVRWPGKVKAGSTSNFKTTLTNFIATCADLVGTPLDENTGEDSQSILPALLQDTSNMTEAMPLIHHSSKGHFAIRKGDWKLIEKRGSGGFSTPVTIDQKEGEPSGQLYNLATDPSEKNNIYNENPKVVDALLLELNNIRER